MKKKTKKKTKKKNNKIQTFQDTILNLQKYWITQGCVVLQPYDIEVGAGTFHPATTLRSLGSKPWRAAYVQPSRRPADGRYGENPNRLQHYYQFQVIIKPSPKEIKKLYLNSLLKIGIDYREHDIRFVTMTRTRWRHCSMESAVWFISPVFSLKVSTPTIRLPTWIRLGQ